MSAGELINRVRYRLDGYFHSEKRSVKLLARALAITLFAAVISTIAPTLADELADDPAMMQSVATEETSSTVEIAPSESSTVSPTPNPTFSPEPDFSRPAVSAASPASQPEDDSRSDTATAEDGAGEALEIQPRYILRIPATGSIDPRATNYFLPQIFADTDDPETEFTMVCISAPAVRFDLRAKGVANNSIEGAELITGDQSGQLIVSATTGRLINLINSFGGLFVSAESGGLSGRSLTFRFVAVTKPVADPAICSAAQSGAITTVRALGLEVSTTKGVGKLK